MLSQHRPQCFHKRLPAAQPILGAYKILRFLQRWPEALPILGAYKILRFLQRWPEARRLAGVTITTDGLVAKATARSGNITAIDAVAAA